MNLYKCTQCNAINAPKKGKEQLIMCWTCFGSLEVVSDHLPFDSTCKMKALSVKNPFAGLIACGVKHYEVRSFKTKYRGPIVICSTAKPETQLYKYYKDFSFGCHLHEAVHVYNLTSALNGHALCVADLVDVVSYLGAYDEQYGSFTELSAIREYFGDKKYYLWKLENIRPIKPVPVKGQLGIYNIEIPIEYDN